MKVSNVKISSRIVGYSSSKFLILKRFDRHNKVITIVLVVALVERWTRDRNVAGSIPGRALSSQL